MNFHPKPPINFNTLLLTLLVILFSFSTWGSRKWIETVDNHILSDTAFAQTIELRVTKLEVSHMQILEALREIKEALKSK